MPFLCSRRYHFKAYKVKGGVSLKKNKELGIKFLLGFIGGAVAVSIYFLVR